MNTKSLNSEFARITNLALDEYGWMEFHREPFFVKSCDKISKQIITLATRPLAKGCDVKLLACTQQVMSIEIETILYRVKQKFDLQEHNPDEFMLLFHAFDRNNAYQFGYSTSLSIHNWNDALLEYV